MSRMRLATSVATTVLVTLLIAAIAYGGVRIQLRATAALQQPTPTSSAPTLHSPTPIKPSPAAASTGLYVIDEDLADPATEWLLVSDCPVRAHPTCHNAV